MADGNDFIKFLPFEISRHILSFLDSRSLFACSCLSRTWYNALNYVFPEIWFEACLKSGIYVRKDKFSDVKEWKSFLHKMFVRRLALYDGTDFNFFVNEFNERIKAIYIHRDKIAIAFSDRIEMWSYTGTVASRVLGCNFEPLFLKVDDSVIIAVSEGGRMSSWDTTSGNYLSEYTNNDSSLTAFDFLTERDTIVCSFYATSIRVSSIFEVGVSAKIGTRQISPIVRVMLAPDPNHTVSEERKTSLLFSLSLENIAILKVELKFGAFTSRYYFTFESTYSLSFLPLQPAYNILPSDVFCKNPGGLLFDGDILYILPPMPIRVSFTFLKWKFRTGERWRMTCSPRIIGLLGIGEKYLAYRVRMNNDEELVMAADKSGRELIAVINAPRRSNLLDVESNIHYIADDYMCLGDTAWLDGLNGENDCGNVYVSIMENKFHLCEANFIPRNE